jgi:hypothetical protein
MTQLEDLSLMTRIAIGAITIALTVAVLFMVEAESEQQPRARSIYEERLLQLDREAIETAYVEHMKKLFSIWLTDYSPEPPKGIRGAEQGRSAYDRAMTAIEKRERELVK